MKILISLMMAFSLFTSAASAASGVASSLRPDLKDYPFKLIASVPCFYVKDIKERTDLFSIQSSHVVTGADNIDYTVVFIKDISKSIIGVFLLKEANGVEDGLYCLMEEIYLAEQADVT